VRFDNANALLSDLTELLIQHRDECERQIGTRASDPSACGLVLLGRTSLNVPQISSPTTLPDWFPVLGGTHCSIVIEDLTWTAEMRLGDPSARVAEMAESLFRLEELLLRRIEVVWTANHQRVNSLDDLLQLSGDGLMSEFFQRSASFRASVSDSFGFRPSAREDRSLVGMLWRKLQATSPDGLQRLAKAMVSALDLPPSFDWTGYETFLLVIGRPSTTIVDQQNRFARSLLLTVLGSCQFITAAAHADAYGSYSAVLVRSASLDLRRSLDGIQGTLAELSHAPGAP
jgi:hypothetical protein